MGSTAPGNPGLLPDYWFDQAAAASGDRLGAAAIARAAAVDRTFLYRHPDVLEKIYALQADPVADQHTGPGAPELRCRSTCSPPARQLEQRLPRGLGEHTRRESGLGSSRLTHR